MTSAETNLQKLLNALNPELNQGEFVFCTVPELTKINRIHVVMSFKEKEGITVILPKAEADRLKLPYSFIAVWITLRVHSSLQAVGLTAAFSGALSAQNISCNVVAAFHHDHIFVDKKDAGEAMKILNKLSQ